MSRLTQWLVRALLRRKTWALEFFLASQALVWGLWLLMPWGAFAVIPQAFTLLGMVPEPIWGVLFAGHGVTHLYVLWAGKVGLCRRAALALACLWIIVVVSLVLTVPLSPAVPIYGTSALACLYVYASLQWRLPDA